jgi:hypothetical protein
MVDFCEKELQSYIEVNAKWVAERLFSHCNGKIGSFDEQLEKFIRCAKAHFMRLYVGGKKNES